MFRLVCKRTESQSRSIEIERARTNIESAMFKCVTSNLFEILQNYIDGKGCNDEELPIKGNVNATRSYRYKNEIRQDETLTHCAIYSGNAAALEVLLSTGQVDLQKKAKYNDDEAVTAYELLTNLIREFPKDLRQQECQRVFNKHLKKLAEKAQQTPPSSSVTESKASFTP